MAGALAAEEPWWEPGSTHGYHVNTFGFLAGEIVRRVAAQSIGAFFRREVGEPLGADFHFGFGAEEDHRVAEYIFGCGSSRRSPQSEPAGEERQFLLHRVYLNPPGLSGLGTVNTRAWRAAEIPSANGHGDGPRGGPYLRRAAWARGRNGAEPGDDRAGDRRGTPPGPDFVLGRPSRFGLGFQLTQPERPLGPNPRSFGHFGLGGSLGFADPDAGLAFAYAMNRSGPRWQNPRNHALIDAVYTSL